MPEFDFGHFHIVDELGRGGMALVYKAVNTQTEETVALKILYPHLMSDEKNIKRFEREARVATQLRHKYIVPVVDFGEHDDQIYIAMKYMPGNSLAELFDEPRNIKMKGIIRILGEVASALDYAHEQGVIHRDLKLQNILLDEKRHAHLSDFGIARLVDGTRLTATGQIAGTPMYMSPEQIRGKPVDHRSDIYSFAVMSYLLLTGYYPFTGEDSLSIIHKHVKEFPPTPTEVNTDLPESVDGVLLRGLMKLPKDRYPTTMDMVKDLYKAVNTPELHQTSTRIDIRAINPVDSVEMDASTEEVDTRIESPTGKNAQSALQSDLSSAVVTGPQILTGQSSRSGIFGVVFGGLIVLAIAIPVILLILGGQNNNDNEMMALDNNNTVAAFSLHQTQTSAPLVQTQTVIAIQLTQGLIGADDDDDDDDDDHNDTIVQGAFPTPASAFEANGSIQTNVEAELKSMPGPPGQVMMMLDGDTPIEIYGRTQGADWIEVRLDDNEANGFVDASLVETSIDLFALPITFVPGSRQPRNNDAPPARPNDPDNNEQPPAPPNDNGD